MEIRILAIAVFLAALAACANAPQTRTSNTAPIPVMPGDRFALYCAPPQANSRIPQDPRHCSADNVQTFTGEQLERTGATQVGDALHYLDPEITITHH